MLNIFLFELAYRRDRVDTYIYFALVFGFGFILAANGANDLSEKAYLNSARTVANLVIIMGVFMTLVAAAVMGSPVYRDLEHGVKNYYFSYPISEGQYLLGRFLGSFVLLLLIGFGFLGGLALGYALGPALGWREAERFGPFRWGDYFHAAVIYLIPNLLLVGTLLFSLVALTRKIFVAYFGSVLFFVFYLIATSLAEDLDNQWLVAMLEPFGRFAFTEQTNYLTPVEQNTFLSSLSGSLLLNRLIWGGVALLSLVFVLWRFNFQHFSRPVDKAVQAKVPQGNPPPVTDAPVSTPGVQNSVSPVTTHFSTKGYVQQLLGQAGIEFRNIMRDPYFLAIVTGAVLFLFFDGWYTNTYYGTRNYPTTYYMLQVKDNVYLLFVLIIIVFYTGEVVHRDRSVGFHHIADALPLPNWVAYGSKLLTLVIMTFFLATMVWVVGVFSQTIQGYYHYDFGQYFIDLYLLTWPRYLVMLSLAFFVHVLANQKFLGHVLAIFTYVFFFFLPDIFAFGYKLFIFGSQPNYLVSDMNDFGHFLPAVTWFNAYWLAFGVGLLLLGLLFYARGTDQVWRSRWLRFRRALGPQIGLGLFVSFGAFLFCGFVIYDNVSVKNVYVSRSTALDIQADYERRYRPYLRMRHPKITSIDLAVDIFPSTRRTLTAATLGLVNRSRQPIDSLLVSIPFDDHEGRLDSFVFADRELELQWKDDIHRLALFRLSPALAPGDSTTLRCVTERFFSGFPNTGFQEEILHNGTFFNQDDVLPGFGYDPQREVSSAMERKRRQLELRSYLLPPADDEKGKDNLLYTPNADVVSFHAIVSTELDQIAVAPGRLQREWTTKEDRRYFEYAEPSMAHYFSLISARYVVDTDVWRGSDGKRVDIQIFRDQKHELNVTHFLDAIKTSLTYYTEHFGPYQFDQIRILEFPRYTNFAQSFPNTVPFSESFGWLGNFSNPDDANYAFTVTAHEVAHQWWGHQIQPSATRGAIQLAETMAEYASLMVTKARYGEAAMQPTLKYKLDLYLKRRSRESRSEKTLLDNDDQGHIWYQKGALVMYALQDYVGEEQLNQQLASFIDSFALRDQGPYPTAMDWYAYLRAATPDSLQYFLQESFERITLYENRAMQATARRIDPPTDLTKTQTESDEAATYELTLRVDTRKITYDGDGNVLDYPTAPSLLEVAVFGKDRRNSVGKTEKTPLYRKKHWLTPGQHTIKVMVKGEPFSAGIDPYNKLIDRVSEDNLIAVDIQ